MTGRSANTLAALRQLACLGLPGREAFPEAMKLLRSLVGFEVDGSLFLDENCDLTDARVDYQSPAVLLDYAENFLNRTDGDGITGLTLKQAHDSGLRVFQSSRFIERGAMQKTAFWNRILRPIEAGWCCQMPLRDGQRPLANLVLMRPFRLPDFSAAEVRLAAQAQSWLSHLLARREVLAPEAADMLYASGESGTVLVDEAGRVLSASAGALALLHQAVGVAYSPVNLRQAVRGEVTTLARNLARMVGGALNGDGTAPPVLRLHGRYGNFQVRAFALQAFAGDRVAQTSLHVERQTPLSLRLFRSRRFLALSQRERDVALRLVAGHSTTAIARDLGIKPSSVIHHTRSLYNRLGVSSQKALLPALLTDPVEVVAS